MALLDLVLVVTVVWVGTVLTFKALKKVDSNTTNDQTKGE